MKIHCIEKDCMDPYFEPHLIAVFSTIEKAMEYLGKMPEYDRNECNINEYEIDPVFESKGN